MKKKLFLFGLTALLLNGCGTMHAIKSVFTSPVATPPPPTRTYLTQPAATTFSEKVKSVFTAPAPAPAPDDGTALAPAPAPAPARTTFQAVVNREVVFMYLAAALLAIAAGIAAYPFANYFVAVHLGLAALALPVVAVFWGLYWAWISATIIIALALWAFIHYKTVLLPAAKAEAAKIFVEIKKV